MPNIMGHETQKEASRRFLEFQPLLKLRYSEKFHFFLCTLFFPMCTNQVNVGIPACRPMCEEMRRKKEPIMRTFGFEWSDSIDCSKLPWESAEDHLCIQHPSYASENDQSPPDHIEAQEYELPEEKQHTTISGSHQANGDPEVSKILDVFIEEPEIPIDETPNYPISDDPINPLLRSVPDTIKEFYDLDERITAEEGEDQKMIDDDINDDISKTTEDSYNEFGDDSFDSNFDDQPPSEDRDWQQAFPPRSSKENICKASQKYVYVESNHHCLPRCGSNLDFLFNASDKKTAFFVLTVCAFLCFCFTAITVGTFLIDSKRFRYPEKPVIFLSICYNGYSVGYLLKTFNGLGKPFSCFHNSTSNVDHIVSNGIKDPSCYTSFYLLYFFGMSASAWWVILNLTWLLSAGFKWSHEAIEKYGFNFHILAWSFPAGQTIAVLLLNKVDGDELTGLCFVGNLDPDSLMYYVIIPLTFYLLIGTVTLLIGFRYLFKIRRVIKHQNGKEAENLEKLMWKIGIFSVLYTVPAACVVAMNFYQYQNLVQWVTIAKQISCSPTIKTPSLDHGLNPNQELFAPDHTMRLGQHLPFSDSWNIQESRQNHNGDFDHFYFHDSYKDSSMTSLYDAADDESFNVKTRNVPHKTDLDHSSELNCHLNRSVPPFPLVFIAKIILCLFPGIMTGIWIGSAKTLTSWQNFCWLLKCRMRPATGSENDRKDLYRERKVVGSSVGEQDNLCKNISQSEEATYFLISNNQSYSLTCAQNELSKPHLSPYGYYIVPNGHILRANHDAHVLTAPSCGDCMQRQNSLTLESSDDVFSSTNNMTSNHLTNYGSRRMHHHVDKGTSIPASNFFFINSCNNRSDGVESVLCIEAERNPFSCRTTPHHSATQPKFNTLFMNSTHRSVTDI